MLHMPCERGQVGPKELEKHDVDLEDQEEDDFEDPLIWSFQYVAVCILLPLGVSQLFDQGNMWVQEWLRVLSHPKSLGQ